MNTIQASNLFKHKRTIYQLARAFQLSLLCCLFSTVSLAKDYKVEVLVFENIKASVATESHNYEPPKEMRSGSETWALEPSLLIEEADTLDNSGEYLLTHHYAWGIESLRYEDSANYSIIEAESRGYIKVYADQLLFTNIDLDYKGFRLQEKRRLKLNEKHFFDHPKFGVLMQVSRLEEKLEDDEQAQPSSEGDQLEASR